jgi:ribosomal protein L37AE/L43A
MKFPMKRGFNKQTKVWLKEIEDFIARGFDKRWIRDYYYKRGWDSNRFYRVWKSFETGLVVKYLKPDRNTNKKRIDKPKVCYWCKDKKVKQHHISYSPEIIIWLCSHCHSRLHYVIKMYHQQIINKDTTIKRMNFILKTVNEYSKPFAQDEQTKSTQRMV